MSNISILSLVLGIVNFIFSISISIPQLFSIFKTRNTSGTSLLTYLIFIVCQILWNIWSFCNYFDSISTQELQLIDKICNAFTAVTNFMSLLLSSAILFFKIRHLNLCKKLKMSELKLSDYLLKKDKNKTKFQKYFSFYLLIFVEICVTAIVISVLVIFAKPLNWSQDKLKIFTNIVMTINIVAAVSWEATSWPQLIKIYKTHDTSGISLGWAIFFSLTCIEVFFYDLSLGFIDHNFFKYMGSLVLNGIIVNTWILILKIQNIHNAKKNGFSEIDYIKTKQKTNTK